MDRLLFSVAPALPNQCGCFLSREPSVARFALLRKRHADQASVKAFFCMMVDGGPERFEVAPRSTAIATVFGVGRAGLGIDLRQFLAAPRRSAHLDGGVLRSVVGAILVRKPFPTL
jgi:hypothetical protein